MAEIIFHAGKNKRNPVLFDDHFMGHERSKVSYSTGALGRFISAQDFPRHFPTDTSTEGKPYFPSHLHLSHWRNPNPLVVGVTIPSGSIELFI